MNENPKVFISYSHQDAIYENKVLEFSNKLRSEGIDASIDLYEEAPSEGWPRWMENQIRKSDYVLVLCSKSYYEKFYSDEKGKGVTWEVSIIYQYLYDSNVETKKFIPIFFEKGEEEFIPTPIKSFTYYNIGADEGYNNLYWRLRGAQKTVKPPLAIQRLVRYLVVPMSVLYRSRLLQIFSRWQEQDRTMSMVAALRRKCLYQ